jgi:nicotinamidase-related amidase
MAIIREGDKTALLIVDMQVSVIDSAWEETLIIKNTKRAVEKARESSIPVIWIQHTNKKMVRGSSGWQLVPELTAQPGEPCLVKHYNSAFEETFLEETLAHLGASHIVLAGALTNECIQATAYAALEKGYDLTLIEDAHTTGDITPENGETIRALDIIREFNIVMSIIRYPGRTSRVVSVEDLDFQYK